MVYGSSRGNLIVQAGSLVHGNHADVKWDGACLRGSLVSTDSDQLGARRGPCRERRNKNSRKGLLYVHGWREDSSVHVHLEQGLRVWVVGERLGHWPCA